MAKRKREAADQELQISGRPGKVKKHKTKDAKETEITNTLKESGTVKEIRTIAQVPESEDHPTKLARKLAKQKRRALQRTRIADETVPQAIESKGTDVQKDSASNHETKAVIATKNETQLVKTKHKEKERKGKSAAWKISDPIGGQMLDLDPVFSLDEKFLLVAYNASITVYSTSTSLPLRQLRTNKGDCISAFAFSSTDSSRLYLSTFSGTIEQWDWVEGLRLGHWRISSSIYFLMTLSQDTAVPDYDLVYTVDRKGHGPWLISAHRLASGDNAAKTDVKTLFTSKEAISSVKTMEAGRVVVATSGTRLIIGFSEDPSPSLLKETAYTWRIIECPEWIVSMDVRARPLENVQKEYKGGKRQVENIDIAVGGLKGSIHLYEDLLRKLIRSDRRPSKDESGEINSRRLHWHRNAVLTVKWSVDGNYIISGGRETTLVLWQLETDHRQHLPHLGAAIESVVVSPFGSSYAIRLADNSAMILSTSELQPTFSIAGIQVPTSQKVRTVLPFVPTVGATTSESKSKQGLRCPACVSSLGPNRLLLAVPPSATSRQPSNTPSNASYLQTFDVGASHQISRQALTRTKITTLNMGPESNIIEEPNVIIVQTSADGQWLATVDEWMPPERDLEPLSFSQARISEEQVFRQEIYLKFWSWNPDSKLWELVSRIDDPHSAPSGNPYDQSRVLALTADPTAVGFATIGEDGIVKTWKPVNRRRNGLEVRSKDGKSLTAWHYQLKIPLESLSEPLKDDSPSGAKLAYSQDGSILVAGFQSSSSCPVYLIDTISGDVQSVQTGIYTGPLLGLGIIHKYLVTLSNELCVWDLVNDKLHYGIDLSAHRLPLETQLASSHFAVDPQQLLFAIALPHNTPRGLGSQVAIFDPADERPLFLTGITASITALVPATGRKGFHVIDSAAEVRTVSPSQAKPWVPIALPKDRAAPSRGLKEIFGNGESALLSKDETDKDAELQISKLGNVTREPPIKATDDAVVVNSDRLAEIFDVGPAYALPPVTQLFEQVASLCSRPINT